MQMTQHHRDTLRALLAWRRDVRHFLSDPVSDAELDMLRAAMDSAPSVGNARPWRVLRVVDPDLRARVRDDFVRENARAAEGYSKARRADYLALKLAGLDEAPEHLAVFTETAPSEGAGLGRQNMPQTLEQSTAMAIHALWLMVRACNIGVGMVSIIDPERMARLFDVPPSWRFTAYLCVGRVVFDDDTPLLHRAGWQENTATRWERR